MKTKTVLVNILCVPSPSWYVCLHSQTREVNMSCIRPVYAATSPTLQYDRQYHSSVTDYN